MCLHAILADLYILKHSFGSCRAKLAGWLVWLGDYFLCSILYKKLQHCHLSCLIMVIMCTVLASEKLAFPVSRFVLELDGTEIDGDDELLEFGGSTLLALQEGETWMPDSSMSEQLPPPVSGASGELEGSAPPALTGELHAYIVLLLLTCAH